MHMRRYIHEKEKKIIRIKISLDVQKIKINKKKGSGEKSRKGMQGTISNLSLWFS